jgi:8-amino-7-oxononanoate synthase
MNRTEQALADKLQERLVAGNLRKLSPERAVVDFYSNDYLGLVTEGRLYELMRSAPATDKRMGSTGSRLLSGNSREAEALEDRIAGFHKAEAALLFNSGYNANVGLLASVAGRNTTILWDEFCHASLIDGMRLSICGRRYKFAHNNLNDLEEKLKKYKEQGPVLVVAESIYSMDGDMAPLAAMANLCETHDAQLIVDEAHATGVTGRHGEGLVCTLGLQDKVFARVHTFGKALGCHGAAVVGNEILKQYLINFARTFIYTTALPAPAIHAAQCAYQYLAGPDFTNEALHEIIVYFRQRIAERGGEGWKDSNSPIQALVTGGNERSKRIAKKLQGCGLQVNAILHPTVPLGMERLRVCLHSFNTRDEVDRLVEVVEK